MKFKIEACSNGRDAEGDTLLDAIGDAQVFWITKEEDGRFEITEGCDNFFSVTLTRDQLLALADEIRELAS